MPTLKTLKTKPEADIICEAMGAHVVALETAEEANYVRSLVRTSKFFLASSVTQMHHVCKPVVFFLFR